MKQWFQNNWFKLFLAVISLIFAIEVFFVLYPYALSGYLVHREYPLSELFFSDKNLPNGIKAINPFEK